MARHPRQLKLHVHGQRREKPDARRIARAIVRLAVEMDAHQAQALANELEDAESARYKRRERPFTKDGDS